MAVKKLIAYINAENEIMSNVVERAVNYSNEDIDEIFIYNYSKREEDKEHLLAGSRQLSKLIDIPYTIGIHVERLEDVKKAIYSGASKVMIKEAILNDEKIISDATDRFGKDKIIVEIENVADFISGEAETKYLRAGVNTLMIKHVDITPNLKKALSESDCSVIVRDALVRNNINELMELHGVNAVATNYYLGKSIIPVKKSLKENGVDIELFESAYKFSDFKLNNDGLLPVVVQDYKNNDVLMMAYMNEEAFEKTMNTGCMTYYSRSRDELWIKGETSGHYQYVKKLSVDCDKDTLLAKVKQVGAACHTGNRTCFYTDIASKKFEETNPSIVLNRVFNIIV